MAKEPAIIRDKNLMRSWSRSMRSQGKTIALVPTMGYLHQGHLSLIQEAKNRAHVTVVSIYVNPGQFSPSEDLATYPSDFQGDLQKVKEAGVDAVFHPQNLYHYETDTKITSGSVGNLGFDDGKDQKLGSSGKDEEDPSGSFGNLDRNVVLEREGESTGASFGNSDFNGGNGRKVVSCIEKEGGGIGHETWIRVEKLERGLCGNSRPVFFRGVATVVSKLFNIVEPDVALFGKKDYQQWRIIRRMVNTF